MQSLRPLQDNQRIRQCGLRLSKVTHRFWPPAQDSEYRNAWVCQWQDVNFADGMIHVRRTWTCGRVGLPKSKASKGAVPLHPLLAQFMLLWKQKTTFSLAGNWVFPS